MGKVISFNELAHNKKMQKGHLNIESLDKYIDMMEIHRDLFEELFFVTEDELKANGFNPDVFKLDEESAHRYVSMDLVELMNGGEESMEIACEGIIEGTTYRTVAYAEIQGEAVVMYVDILKKEGEEWFIKTDNGWEQGPGDLF